MKVEKKLKARLRRTNLELVGLSRQHLLTIKRISEMSQVPISRVGTDVIEIGIAAVLSTYQPMIEMENARKERSEKIKRIFNEPETSTPTRPGVPDEQADVGEIKPEPETGGEGVANAVALDFERATVRRPDDADEQSGFWETDNQDLGSVNPDGETVTRG